MDSDLKNCLHCPRRFYTSFGYLRHLKDHEDGPKTPETQAAALSGTKGQGYVQTEAQGEILFKDSSEAQTNVKGQVLTQVVTQVADQSELQGSTQVETAAGGDLAEPRTLPSPKVASEGSDTFAGACANVDLASSPSKLTGTRKSGQVVQGENNLKLQSNEDEAEKPDGPAVTNPIQVPGFDSIAANQGPANAGIRQPNEHEQIETSVNENEKPSYKDQPPMNEEVTSTNEEEFRHYKCEICLTEFGSANNLTTHIRNIHGTPPQTHECELCLKTFSRIDTLRRHIKLTHDQIGAYTCDLCPKTFGKIRSLRSHLKATHGIRRTYKCELCPKTFTRMNTLRQHITLTHYKIRPYKCELCPKTFGEIRRLRIHIQVTHDQIKAYKCELCPKTFGEKSCWSRHIKVVHENTRPHKCELCPKTFGKKSGLSSHIKVVHENTRPHKCDLCPKAFGTVGCLKKHIKQKHQNEKNPNDQSEKQNREEQSKSTAEKAEGNNCKLCPRAFKSRNSLIHHVQVIHEKIKPL